MNCQTITPLLSDFTDETLEAPLAWQVQTHLSGCADCARIVRDFEKSKRLVQGLPAAAPSAGFDAALRQRLALTRRPATPVQTWRTRLAAVFSSPAAAPPQRLRPAAALRPALALGAALVAGAAVFLPVHPPTPVPAAVVRGADPAFVADCLAQHRRDAAAEPLADLSAQTLAGSLDNSVASDPSASAAGTSSSADLRASDPGEF